MQWIFTHFPRGLPTSSLFFFAISPLILKGLVPILQHLCRIFRNTPTFSLSDGFQRSYGHCFWDPTFFYSPCIHIYFIRQLCVDIESHILPHGGLLFIVYRYAGSHNSSIIGISTLAYISVSISYWQHRMWKKTPNAQNTFITEGSRNNKTI